MPRVRRRAIVVAAALAAAVAAAAVAGTAGAQAVAPIVVLPGVADPGAAITVSNGPSAPCPPPPAAKNPSASVDLYAIGSATPVNRVPYQGAVSVPGAWSVTVRLDPDLPPGSYRVQAGCYSDSGLNSGFGPAYAAGNVTLRLQEPGSPTVSARRGRPGDSLQVSSADNRCSPPAGSPSPRVRVSLLDASRATRAEAEGPVDPTTGRWTVGLRVPDLDSQSAEISAVCLARVGAPSPYARYRSAPFAVDNPPVTMTTPTTAPVTTGGAGGSTTTPSTTPRPTASTLPPTPLAVAIVAEPTYTG
jgi:hypothetical protein